MPLLHHAMRRTLTGNGQTIELAGKTDGEIADINHLLHFTATFRSDLADLYHDQPPHLILGRAYPLAQEPDDFTAARRWDQAPCLECLHRVIDDIAHRRRVSVLHIGNRSAGRRRTHGSAAFLIQTTIDAKVLKDRSGFLSEI